MERDDLAVLLVTHNMAVARALSDRVGILKDGILKDGILKDGMITQQEGESLAFTESR